jgi:hypothetical protein
MENNETKTYTVYEDLLLDTGWTFDFIPSVAL